MKTWKSKEIQHLKIYYPYGGVKKCQKFLNRTISSINQKAFELKIICYNNPAFRVWTQAQELKLIKLYPVNGARYCAKELEMSLPAIKNKVKRLNLKRERNIIETPDGFRWCPKCRQIKSLSKFRQTEERTWRTCKLCHLTDVNLYEKRNKKRIQEYRNKYSRENKNPHFRIAKNLRTRLYVALKGSTKSAPTMKLIGCSLQELKLHLEKQFQQGMNWNNYGKWHIDHIRPCASFDLTKSSEQYQCFNFNNLKPLWARDNIIKGKTYNFSVVGLN